MAWAALIVSGICEVIWAFAMKQSQGFTLLLPSIVTAAAAILGFGLLAFAMRSLPLGPTYAIWTGIGAVGTFLLGVVFLGEAASLPRLIAAALILAGLLLMALSSSGD